MLTDILLPRGIRGHSAGEWVARSLINTAARFLLRPRSHFR